MKINKKFNIKKIIQYLDSNENIQLVNHAILYNKDFNNKLSIIKKSLPSHIGVIIENKKINKIWSNLIFFKVYSVNSDWIEKQFNSPNFKGDDYEKLF